MLRFSTHKIGAYVLLATAFVGLLLLGCSKQDRPAPTTVSVEAVVATTLASTSEQRDIQAAVDATVQAIPSPTSENRVQRPTSVPSPPIPTASSVPPTSIPKQEFTSIAQVVEFARPAVIRITLTAQ
jgi:hypothetical protein